MRFWWVNQNQTYRHEIQGGYLWSPKKNANGARNPFYESIYESYKWLFISVALGNENAKDDLTEVNALLGVDEIDPGFDMAMEWFSEKFEESLERQEEEWSMELLRWRFGPACVH